MNTSYVNSMIREFVKSLSHSY